MEHVVTRVTEQILHALLALDDRTDRSAQLTLQPDLGRIPLHDVLGHLWRRVAVPLTREVNHFVVGIRIDFLRRQRGLWRPNAVVLLRLKAGREVKLRVTRDQILHLPPN
jgi:hypothetical protein